MRAALARRHHHRHSIVDVVLTHHAASATITSGQHHLFMAYAYLPDACSLTTTQSCLAFFAASLSLYLMLSL